MTQLAENLKAPLVELLLSVADDKLMLGHRNSDWTGLGPILEEDIAFSSLAQDEIAHAQILYELASEFDGRSTDVLAFGRDPTQFRCAEIVELPDDFDWAFALCRQFFCDHYDALRLGRMARSSYAPLAAIAARLAAYVLDVPTVLIARTDAQCARLLTSDIDPVDRPFLADGPRTAEGFLPVHDGLDFAIARSLAYAPYADMLWCETSTPDLDDARRFADAIHDEYPDKMLAYNCSPSFNWNANLSDRMITRFQKELAAMGYRFQFVTLAGFHALNHGMFRLARGYRDDGMAAYARLQECEFADAAHGYTAVRHQHEVGTGYFDEVAKLIGGGDASTLALESSTEAAQF